MLTAALVLVVGQALLRGWVASRGYFTIDDFQFISEATAHHLQDTTYLLHSYNGHLMPAAWIEVWLTTKAAPLGIAPAVAASLAFQAATGVMLYVLLRELFGDRKAILVPLALFLFSPLTLPGFLWWAAAINQLPAMLAVVVTLYLHVRYLRTGSYRTAVYSIVAFFLGLAFFEKVLLFTPIVFAFTAFYFVPGTWWQRLRDTVLLHWRVWATWVVLVVPYVLYYESHVNSTVSGRPSPTGFVDLLETSLRGLRAGALTGPWSWSAFGGGPANTLPVVSNAMSTLSWIVLVAVVGGGALVYRQSLRSWLLPLGYFLATVALLSAGRFQIGPIIGSSYRYFSEAVLLAALALALALLPITGTSEKGAVTALTPRSWVGPARLWRLPGQHHEQVAPLTLSSNSRRVVVRFLVIVVVGSSVLSSIRYDAFWKDNVATGFVATARHDFATHTGLVLADTAVPGAMMPAVFFPQNTLSHALSSLPHQPRYLELGQSSASLKLLDDKGAVQPLKVVGIKSATGPREDCGWFASGNAGALIRLDRPTFDYVWTIRIGYIASTDTRATIKAGRTTVHVQLKTGLNPIYLFVRGVVSNVVIEGLAPGASVCTDDVVVGNVAPDVAPDTAPDTAP